MEYLEFIFKEHGLELTKEQAEQFELYYEMLIEKNKVMNLTAITDYKEVVVKHFLDSVYLAKYEDLSGDCLVIDVGTGAGFPGIPLKILFPRMKLVLLDSLNKRILFLREVIEKLGLENVEAIHGRAEEIARKSEYREQFDYCVSRAVANLNSLSEICLPFVKTGGAFISYKSMKGMEELEMAGKAISLLGGASAKEILVEDAQTGESLGPDEKAKTCVVEKFILEEKSAQVEAMERSFIRIPKEKPTPKKYPRKPGTPFKEPLK